MTTDIAYAVRTLVEARRSGVQVAPPVALSGRDDVYAVQDGVAAAYGPVAGWKVGMRTPQAEGSPAPLLAGAVVPSPARFDGARMHMIGVEVEIAFRIARDLPPSDAPVGRDDALAVVGQAVVAMEVVDTRLADFRVASAEWLLADNQMNHALVTGTPVPRWHELDWAGLEVSLEIDGTAVVAQKGGLGCADPTLPLIWLVDHVVRWRGGLRAGQVVTTGSWTGLRYFPPGTVARGAFAGLGSVEATF